VEANLRHLEELFAKMAAEIKMAAVEEVVEVAAAAAVVAHRYLPVPVFGDRIFQHVSNQFVQGAMQR
jgi:hypothetical protein